MHPTDFTDDEFTVQQADTADHGSGRIQRGDLVTLTGTGDGPYTLHFRRPDDSEQGSITGLSWDSDYGSVRGPGENPDSWVQISFYDQDSATLDPLRVIYGVIIDQDPENVGTWAADDHGG
jgi:hypothetical protein